MTVLWIVLTASVLAALYLLALRGRCGHPDLSQLTSWRYAHRGLHNGSRPENSMAAFRSACEQGYGIELDVHLLADGELAVFHDSALKRMTGAEASIEDLTVNDLSEYYLGDTQEQIPLLKDVLSLVNGRVPLIVELKAANGNASALCQTAATLLEQYKGCYCVESFDPRCVRWYCKHRHDVVRGQLAADFMKGKSEVPWIIRYAMTHLLLNFLTRPDFIAYEFCDRKRLSVSVCRSIWKIKGVAWTLQASDQLQQAEIEEWTPIFEGFTP